MKTKPRIIAIVGPTATGKSDLGVLLAKQCNGEIISADSRQVYCGLDIGSGKITKKEMRKVPHHLIDIRDPKHVYSVAHFQRDGRKAIKDILSRGKLPIVVGGTGFYVDALLTDMSLPEVKPDAQLRKKLEKFSASELHAKLRELDPKRAESIDARNPVRLIRAIEIATYSGPVAPVIISSPYDVLYIGLKADNTILKERILLRLTKRIKRGMLAEFRNLHANGLSWKRMEELGLEYRYGARLLQKQITRDQFMTELTSEIYKYAKRQITWWKRNSNIHWLNIGDNEHSLEITKSWLNQSPRTESAVCARS